MAKNNVEIEVKIPVNLKDFKRIQRHLKKVAKLTGTHREIDKYLNSPHRDFLKSKHPTEYLRLRDQDGAYFLTYKKYHFSRPGQKTHADEYETRIEDLKQLERIFSVLNFKNFLTVDKRRQTFRYLDKFEIDLDIVADLGYFVEIEALADLGGINETHRQVAELARELDLDTKKADQDGYVLLLMKKRSLTS